jgi:4-diphosphocytidyl-2-C-methyl-D-erythritol kinase
MMTEQRTIAVRAPAKINLFLRVVGRRRDGYHEIYSLIQTVNLFDEIELTTKASGIDLTCDVPGLPVDESNLVCRACRLLQEHTRLDGGVDIRLRKRIPIGSGLGGGSSDAAATLKGIRELYGLRLSDGELARIGSRIGSDVPLFFSRGQALISGRGEVVEETSLPTDYRVALVVPDFSVSTSWAYSQLRILLTSFSPVPTFHSDKRGQEFYKSLSDIGNDFADLVVGENPEVGVAMDDLRRAGAQHVGLSGSGSAFYGLFGMESDLDMETLFSDRIGWKLFNLRPVCF